MDKWHRKVALVTGASSGIGKAITKKLVENGMKVVACAENQEINSLSSELNSSNDGEVFPYQCDVTNEEQMLSMFKYIKEKFGTLHVCVNGAGVASKRATLLDGKTEDWKHMLDVNILGLCVGVREAVKLMRETGVDDGHVINVGSLSGHRLADMLFYSATKFAVVALTEGLRRELVEAKTHIRVTSVSPGLVKTNFQAVARGNVEEAERVYASNPCLQPNDIGSAVVFALQSPAHMSVNDIIIRPTEQTY